jgi:hypothetical protein
MATKEKDIAVPAKKRTRKPVSLKIDNKRKKAQAAAAEKPKKKVKLVFKKSEMKRVVRKSQVIIRRSLKAALKGVEITHVPDSVYKKIDSSIAKNAAFGSMIETAVISIVSTLTSVKPASKNGTRKPRAAKEKVVAKKDTATVTDQKKKPRAKKKDVSAESVTA